MQGYFVLLLFLTPLASPAQDMLGHGTLNDIEQTEWFENGYSDYRVKDKKLAACAGSLKDKQVVIVMGTWCDDSRREVPRFFKIWDQAEGKPVKLIFLDEDKKGPGQEEKQYEIDYVPTIIIYDHKGGELGRIIEHPNQSLEKDLCAIVN